MAQKVEVKEILVTWNDEQYRINEGEEIVNVIPAAKRTDICTVVRLNAKSELDTRQFWMPDGVEYYIPTGKAGTAMSLEAFGATITSLNTVLAARAAVPGGATNAR